MFNKVQNIYKIMVRDLESKVTILKVRIRKTHESRSGAISQDHRPRDQGLSAKDV